MAHITLSIPDEVYKEMKRRSEIKWSEIARASITAHLKTGVKSIRSKELLEMLPKETRESIRSTKEKSAIRFTKRVEKEEWKRVKSLTQTS